MGGLLIWILVNYVESMKTNENIQEQMGYTICLGCDGLYSDEETKLMMSDVWEV
jgi:hypothetical protein